jgi:hypothetical protein
MRLFQSKGQSNLRRDSIASDSSSLQDKKLQNQFSFVERATQTMNNSHKVSTYWSQPCNRCIYINNTGVVATC